MTMDPAVSVLVGRDRVAVQPVNGEAEIPAVPATHVVIELEGQSVPSELLINDEFFPVIRGDSGRRGHVLLDATRATGFHQFTWQGQRFCFATVDGKLRLEGILELLSRIGREGLSWGQQLIFSDGSAIRDPRVDFAWLRRIRRDAIQLFTEVSENPARRLASLPRLQRPRGGRALIPETLSALRGRPHLLEAHPSGLLKVGGVRYMPRRVVARSTTTTHDTIGNRRATRLLLDLLDLSAELRDGGQVPKRGVQWLNVFDRELSVFQRRFPFCNLERESVRLPPDPSPEEIVESRYEAIYGLWRELVHERGWSPTDRPTDRYAYVAHSDQIFQAFVAVVMAEAFGADRRYPFLRPGLDEASFRSDRWEIYYDTAPPRPQFTSWRDDSCRPAALTPDYTFLDLGRGRGLLGDAKYRAVSGNGRLPSSSLTECQAYMQHFGVPSFAVFYPGEDRFLREVSGEGNVILEVSITSFDGLVDWVRHHVRPRLEALMHVVR